MPFFQPHDCSIDLATPYWLLAALALLALAALALVIQAIILLQRVRHVGAAWWSHLLVTLELLWAGICSWYLGMAYNYYRQVTTPSQCGPGSLCSYKGICIPVAQVGDMTQFALVVAALLLGAGWLALVRLSYRIQPA